MTPPWRKFPRFFLDHWHTDSFYSTDLFWNVAEFVWCDICTVCPTNWKTRCDLFPQRLFVVSKQEQTSVISDWLHFKIMSQMYLVCVFYVPFISFKLTFSFSYLWSAKTGQEISLVSSQLHSCLMCPSPREQTYGWSSYLLPSQIQQRNYRVDVK